MAKVSFQMSYVQHKEWFYYLLGSTYPNVVDVIENYVTNGGSGNMSIGVVATLFFSLSKLS